MSLYGVFTPFVEYRSKSDITKIGKCPVSWASVMQRGDEEVLCKGTLHESGWAGLWDEHD